MAFPNDLDLPNRAPPPPTLLESRVSVVRVTVAVLVENAMNPSVYVYDCAEIRVVPQAGLVRCPTVSRHWLDLNAYVGILRRDLHSRRMKGSVDVDHGDLGGR